MAPASLAAATPKIVGGTIDKPTESSRPSCPLETLSVLPEVVREPGAQKKQLGVAVRYAVGNGSTSIIKVSVTSHFFDGYGSVLANRQSMYRALVVCWLSVKACTPLSNGWSSSF